MWSDEDDFLDGVDLDAIDPGAPAAGAPAAAGGAPDSRKRKPPPSEGLGAAGAKKPRQQSASAFGEFGGGAEATFWTSRPRRHRSWAPAAGAGGGGRRRIQEAEATAFGGRAAGAKKPGPKSASAFASWRRGRRGRLSGRGRPRRHENPGAGRGAPAAAGGAPDSSSEEPPSGAGAAGAKKPGPKVRALDDLDDWIDMDGTRRRRGAAAPAAHRRLCCAFPPRASRKQSCTGSFTPLTYL